MGVYSGWDSFLLNLVVKFSLTKYLLCDFLLSDGGDVEKYIRPQVQGNKTQSKRKTAAETKHRINQEIKFLYCKKKN